jgi:putative hydrolase of the HAD superfamily
MTIELLLFDLDDVLVEYRQSVRCRALGARLNRDADAIHRALFESGLEAEADLGRIDAETQARRLGEALDAHVEVEDCIVARAVSMTPALALSPIIEALSARCRLAVLTNNGFLIRDHFARLCPPFAPFFEGRVHCSAMYGICKPETAIFQRCAKALNVAPERVFFVDDKAENALGAERAGMIGHHYRGADALRAQLSRLDLLEHAADAS